MKLTEQTIKGFVNELASDSPAPGGGSTAALQGALGVGLISMVAELTILNKAYAETKDEMLKNIDEATVLKENLVDIIDRDTEAFNLVSAVFAMPKETEADKAKRKDAMQEALKACTLPPFDVIAKAQQGILLGQKVFKAYNTNAASDLGVAALSLKSAARGAWLNILINIDGIKDQTFAKKYKTEGQAMLKQVETAADALYTSIEASLK